MKMTKNVKTALLLFVLAIMSGFGGSALADNAYNNSGFSGNVSGLINTVRNLSNHNYYNPYANSDYSYQIAKRNYYLAQMERINQERFIAKQLRAERDEKNFYRYNAKRHGFLNYYR